MDRFQRQAANADELRAGQEQAQRDELLGGLGATAMGNAESAHQHAAAMVSARREAERQANEAENLRRA